MSIILSLRGRGRRIAVGLRQAQLRAFSHNTTHLGLGEDSVSKKHAVLDQEAEFGSCEPGERRQDSS